MAKYLSGRFKKTPQNALPADRYRYLSPGDAEPNFGDPVFPGQSPPFGQQYQIVSVEGYPGERFWVPISGGIIPGSLTIFDEGEIRGGLSSTTQLNFTGLAITAFGTNNGLVNPGVAVTIKVFAPGNNQEILFNESNDFSTSSKLTFDKSLGLLRAGDRLTVGTGGTIITTTGFGSVGIGTINPTQELHVQGDVRITGTIYDYFNSPGDPAFIIAKNNFGGISWINPSTIRSGAGGTYQNVQFHNSVGLVDGASNFVYDEVNKRVGIGSTQPTTLLDILGTSRFTGPTQMSQLNVIGVTTTQTLAVSGTSTTRNLLVSGITTLGFLTGTSAFFTGIVTASRFIGEITLTNLDVPGVATIGTLRVTGLTTTRNLQVSESTTLNNVNISGITTLGSQVNINNLNVTGVGTFDNIKLDTNTVSTNSGNLLLDSAGGTTQINDSLYINDTTQATNKDTGSIITEGGVGIERNLFVGGQVSLATLGGITTTGGDLYVGSNLFVSGDITYDEINGRRAIFSEYLETRDFRATGISTLNTISVGGTATFGNIANFNGAANFNGNVVLGNANTDTVTFTSLVNSNILPSANVTYDIGSTSNRWNNIWASTFNGTFIGNADTATRLQTPRNIDIEGDVLGIGAGVTFDGSRNISIPTELTTTGVTSGTYGSATQVGRFSVDAKGRLTSAFNVNIDFSSASVNRASYADTAGIATNLRGGIAYQIPYQSGPNVTGFITNGTTTGQLLQYNTGSAPSWVNPSNLTVARAGYADEAGLSTNIKRNAVNQILYQIGNNNTGVLTSGVANQLLQSNGIGNTPSWVSLSDLTAGKASYADTAGIATNLRGGIAYQIPYQSGPNVTGFITNGTTTGQLLQYNTGSAPSWVNPSNLTVGRAGYADSAGIATNLRGGNTYQIPYQNTSGITSFISTSSAQNGWILQYNLNSAPSWVSPTNLTIAKAGYADSAGIATNLRGGNTFQIPYQNTTGVTSFISTSSAQNGWILQYNLNSAPSWIAATSLTAARAGYADSAGIATNLRGGNTFQIPYQNTTGVTSFISTSNAFTGHILQYNTNSAPSWVAATNLTVSRASYADVAGVATDLNIVASNQLVYQISNTNTDVLPPGNSFELLQSNGPGNAPSWASPTGLAVSYAARAGLATNVRIAGTNQLLYQITNNDTGVLSIGNTGELLQSNGSSNAPSWVPLSNLTASKAIYADRAGIATNIANGKRHELVYQIGPDQTGFIGTSPVSGYILQYNDNTLPPSWVSPTNLSVKTSVTAANLSGGNTYQIPYQIAPNTTQFISTTGVGDGWILRYNTNSAPTWVASSSISAGIATAADDLTFPNLVNNPNKPRLIYQWDSYDTRTLGTGTNGFVLRSNGIGATPSWTSLSTLTGSDGGITIQSNSSQVGTANSTSVVNFSTDFTVTLDPINPKRVSISANTSGDNFFAAGTKLLFFQANAPTGWTRDTTHNNKALRVVSGTGGGSGGSIDFTTAFTNRTVPLVDHNHTINDPGHAHNYTQPVLFDDSADGTTDNEYTTPASPNATTTTNTTGISIRLASQSGYTTGNTMNFAVQYIDVIVCTKN